MFIMFPSATYNKSQLQSVVIFNEFSSGFVVMILLHLLILCVFKLFLYFFSYDTFYMTFL